MPYGMRVARTSRWLVATLWLSGCGGGVWVTWGGGVDGSTPSVNLAAAVTSVSAGQPVPFVAAASDEIGVDHVSFYRLDGNGATLLGSDVSSPYEWTAIAPADGRTMLSVFARAVDHQGHSADSPTVTVAITP